MVLKHFMLNRDDFLVRFKIDYGGGTFMEDACRPNNLLTAEFFKNVTE